jgi:hypothetical protein
MCLRTPFITARTRRKFGFQRRRRVLFAWLMTLPKCGILPHISHFRAMLPLQQNSPIYGKSLTEFPRPRIRIVNPALGIARVARNGQHALRGLCNPTTEAWEGFLLWRRPQFLGKRPTKPPRITANVLGTPPSSRSLTVNFSAHIFESANRSRGKTQILSWMQSNRGNPT